MSKSGSISEIALIFVTDEDFDTQVNRALAAVGQSLGISRCSLFLDSADGLTTSKTHEWCADGVQSQLEHLRDIPYSGMPSWRALLEDKTVSAVNDIECLPADIKNALEPQGVRSIVFAPVRVGDRAHGFLAFSECGGPRAWSVIETETLKMISGMITTAYSKKALAEQLAASEANFREYFHVVDDIIVITDLEGRPLFANEGATSKLGYSLEELRSKNVLDLRPPEKWEEARRMLDAVLRRELASCPIELVGRYGTLIPVETRVWLGKWDGRDCMFCLSKDLSAEQAALQKFEKFFRSNPAAMAVNRPSDRRFVDVNDAFLEALGYTREEVIGQSSLELALFVDDERWLRAREELLRTGAIRNRELSLRREDGSPVHVLFSGDTIDIQGQTYLLMVAIDTTKQIQLRTDLTAEHDRLTNVIEGARLGTWEWNVQTGETTYNERWAQITGYTLAELAPTSIDTWTRLTHPDDVAESDRLVRDHFEGTTEFYVCESRMLHKNGQWIWVMDRGKVIERDLQGRPLLMYGTHADITEKKAMEDQIRELAIRDPLTGVYNRRYVFERLEEIVAEHSRYGRRFCVSVLDIDHFKAVNDTLGHQAGDFALREFARTIGSAIRQYDLLGRYGGEEFIIISANASGSETAAMVERVMGMVRGKAFVYEGNEIRFTFSCGLADSAEFVPKALSVEAIITLADNRLYEAKAAGRDRCVGPEAGRNAGVVP
jgi:diguanylate cyclase (GGDEF)-like protein/PAS domain S-box-containing protein